MVQVRQKANMKHTHIYMHSQPIAKNEVLKHPFSSRAITPYFTFYLNLKQFTLYIALSYVAFIKAYAIALTQISLFRLVSEFIVRDCQDIQSLGYTESGEYEIDVSLNNRVVTKHVYCDMDIDEGGWMVIQRRLDGSVNFRRNWHDFNIGFGSISGSFWIGNEFLHNVTNYRNYKLRFDLEDWEGQARYAQYSAFVVGSEQENYRLQIGDYSGDAGDSFSNHNNVMFSTYDADNDNNRGSCIGGNGFGGFWLNSCMTVGVNNFYSSSSTGRGHNTYDRIRWDTWHGRQYSLKRVSMMIKPVVPLYY